MVCATLQKIKIRLEEMHWATGILQHLRVSYTIDSAIRQASNWFFPRVTKGNKSTIWYCPSINNLNIMHYCNRKINKRRCSTFITDYA